MKYVLVSGVVVEERDPLSGIVDIDKEVKGSKRNKNLKLIIDAVNSKDKSSFTDDYPHDYPEDTDFFETYPFTGTVEDEVTIYWGC